MVAGSFAAHSLGVVAVAARRAATSEVDGGTELHGRVAHGSLTVLPVIAGVGLVEATIALSFRNASAWSSNVNPSLSLKRK